ncbi:ribonuclease E inhibitor RraB [Bowmanella sp. JS7-9]|uniref:Regulator of ribonuclease activity B n=1 Tax=Pseudobowmanella zhangzhouensis TaxID=1537679 RepID=A0ABW1XQS5_9ALTE|nr:ribonuclease E inhibitor RraB [Bowmanella sp. JS7-9]TBX21883.1 regulator [Bowmanella sp. JS7-9]
MSELEEWLAFNRETVDALLADGSDPDAVYSIEYHFASNNFDKLEKAAVDAFKAGFEVGDAEEMILDDGGTLFCFDAVAERDLNVEQLDADTKTLMTIADKHNVYYDGWGTHFIES